MPNLIRRYDLKHIRSQFHSQSLMQELAKLIQLPTIEYAGLQNARGKSVHTFKARTLPSGYLDIAELKSNEIEFSIYENNGFLAQYIIYDEHKRVLQEFTTEEIEINVELDDKMFVFEPPPGAQIQDETSKKIARRNFIEMRMKSKESS